MVWEAGEIRKKFNVDNLAHIWIRKTLNVFCVFHVGTTYQVNFFSFWFLSMLNFFLNFASHQNTLGDHKNFWPFVKLIDLQIWVKNSKKKFLLGLEFMTCHFSARSKVGWRYAHVEEVFAVSIFCTKAKKYFSFATLNTQTKTFLE